jgi:hypothetical protein
MGTLQRNRNAPRTKLGKELTATPIPQLQRRKDEPKASINPQDPPKEDNFSGQGLRRNQENQGNGGYQRRDKNRGPRSGDFEEASDLKDMNEVQPREAYREQNSRFDNDYKKYDKPYNNNRKGGLNYSQSNRDLGSFQKKGNFGRSSNRDLRSGFNRGSNRDLQSGGFNRRGGNNFRKDSGNGYHNNNRDQGYNRNRKGFNYNDNSRNNGPYRKSSNYQDNDEQPYRKNSGYKNDHNRGFGRDDSPYRKGSGYSNNSGNRGFNNDRKPYRGRGRGGRNGYYNDNNDRFDKPPRGGRNGGTFGGRKVNIFPFKFSLNILFNKY